MLDSDYFPARQVAQTVDAAEISETKQSEKYPEKLRNIRDRRDRRDIALSLCEEILAFSHAFGSLAVRRVAL